ncbi:MAG: bifunctional diaminohydroxyphosphoribosylaminopyrimidine deaminase/5-amino-6-(5-phosphoribosylamino)uracil reductase RibD [Bacteroidetes bacterium]|nr:bifunctional diaminohydroxyphosphoribosylaminopyrimidine deaminase/5-amino-6-(5-phosphoribosylamino)uracil reductase RibD [Bacteroidota bacterium]
MQRCIQLAALGAGKVSPNPLVGAVLVYDQTIIGEGYHISYGGPHAEIHCIQSVSDANKHLIPLSVLYVSLEPCAHYGKTPPCTKRIIEEKIPQVVIGSMDPYPKVNGRGMSQLIDAGIEVYPGFLKKKCDEINKRFFCVQEKKRPYIILKWACTANHKMASAGKERLMISNTIAQRMVHKWRVEEDAIMVGTRTALLDNPKLNNRFFPGKAPIRLIPDRTLSLPSQLHIFDKQQRTIILNEKKNLTDDLLEYKQIKKEPHLFLQDLFTKCLEENIQSILVEGGATLINHFIKENAWDEMRVITNEKMIVQEGIEAPGIKGVLYNTEYIQSDRIEYYRNNPS